MFDNVATKRKLKPKPHERTRRKGGRVHRVAETQDSAPIILPQAAFVNRVVLDNTVPEGWRYERVLTGGSHG